MGRGPRPGTAAPSEGTDIGHVTPGVGAAWWGLSFIPGQATDGDAHCGCLQAGQYASVFVDNGSGTTLTIQSGSSFSGLLLGT